VINEVDLVFCEQSAGVNRCIGYSSCQALLAPATVSMRCSLANVITMNRY